MSINEFIKKIANDIKLNKQDLETEDFYYILKYIGVTKDMSLSEDIVKFYHNFLDNLGNSLIKYETRQIKDDENATYYIGFYVDKKADYREAIKVYFPVKYEYQISALKTVFLYLIRNTIKATVKFYVKATNENIVIRFYNKDDVIPFINYCYKNFVLEDLLLKPNPFIATLHGIGLVNDSNSSLTYNSTLSILLSNYFKYLKASAKLDLASDLDFLDFVNQMINKEDDEEAKFNMEAIYNNIKTILNHETPVL